MSFTYTLGLLGLLGIPFLIILYILKNKHTEQVIASTYLWTLSECFLKRRKPISRITGIISLILQILAVACISLGIAHPEIILRGKAKDYVFVLDASGSMQYVEEGVTRFDMGKNKIAEIIDGAVNGSSYTVICAGDSTGVMINEEQQKKQALAILEQIQPSATDADIVVGARQLAQDCFNKTPASKIYLITDRAYEGLENVTLVNVGNGKENYAVSDLVNSVQAEGMVVDGKVVSYASDKELTVRLEISNSQGVAWSGEQKISVKAGEEKAFSFTSPQTAFLSLKARIIDEDGMPLDNESVLYNVNHADMKDSNSVALVTSDKDGAVYLETLFITGELAEKVEVMSMDEYKQKRQEVYQLYVFDGCTPTDLPDGAVWFINPKGSVTGSGFSVTQSALDRQGDYYVMEYNDSTNSRVIELLKGVSKSSLGVKTYEICSFYRNFHTLLSHDGNPLVAAGTNDKGAREVVFAFDFQKSNFPLAFDSVILIRNLWKYTFPSMLTKTSYACGENLLVNVFSDSDSVRIDTPSGEIIHLDAGSDIAEYTMTEVGTYTITQQRASGPQTAYVYGNLPSSERSFTDEKETFAVEGVPVEEGRDGIYDDLVILLIILAVIFLADWGVYCYEQYQLR